MDPLDNPIWTALTTKQLRFAETCKLARRFPIEVTPLGALSEPSEEAYASLACLQKEREATGILLHEDPELPAGWILHEDVPLVQMVCEKLVKPPRSAGFVELGEADVREMVALAKLTKPGPFGARTRELGTYIGIRQDGRLAAMAGERLQFPGYTEVSAVCTHPDFAGRGYAAALMSELIERIEGRGETAFLHVRGGNERAIGIYGRMGFKKRVTLQLAVVRGPASSGVRRSDC